MRKHYNDILRKIFCDNLVRTRVKNGLTQAKMAELLIMDDRSYIELDHGKNSCSALTLSLFLIYCCTDVNSFLKELRAAYEKEAENIA